MKSKGYPKDTCINHGIGGFFLGVIWLIVDLFMCSGVVPCKCSRKIPKNLLN